MTDGDSKKKKKNIHSIGRSNSTRILHRLFQIFDVWLFIYTNKTLPQKREKRN